MGEGFRTFEHTGDLGLEVWADGPERLYALAAVALHAQIIQVAATPEAPPGGATIERRLALEGEDESDLLVHWLNSSLLEAELARAVWTRAEVRSLTARGLEGSLAGPRRDRVRQVFLREVKAVSHHALELDLTPGACRCRLILDI
jgi:SHS2 domain-containing protein